MKRFNVLLLVLGVLFCGTSYFSSEASLNLVDKVDAGLRDPTLPPKLLDSFVGSFLSNNEDAKMNCQFSTTKGRRWYQEDRVVCNLDMDIPFHGYNRADVVKVGLVAVFDGHIGEEASDMASKELLLRFFVNALSMNLAANTDRDHLTLPMDRDMTTLWSSENDHVVMVKETYREVLKGALLKALDDIDDAFMKEAAKHNLASGTTAVIALLVDSQILVAKIGDSRALLCYANGQSSEDGGLLHLSPKILTRDHNAFIDVERARIEEAGGYFSTVKWTDVPVINGHFPMTRAIGDAPMRKYGIISTPEVTRWLPLSENDKHLIVASDGIFESLTTKDVCNLLSATQQESAAEFIVQSAYARGSTDNLSVVVVPLE